VSPGLFIPIAERCGLMPALGRELLAMACTQLGHWRNDPRFAALRLSVNLSASQLYAPDFVTETRDLLARTGCPPDHLVLELTESMLVDDMEAAVQTMATLRDLGIRFSIDDFGTGYSSLAYLQRLPLDELKIDRSFVQDLPDNASSLAIVRSIVALARSLGLRLIAEGVEEPHQVHALLKEGCSSFQGYRFHRPMAVADFEDRVRRDATPCRT
jgi:EAL domain-containing protein (putative c-di-GMP-specific phosphodiesterase class I)